MRRLVFIYFVILTSPAFGQITLSSHGNIPEELFLSTNTKYEKKKKEAIELSVNEPKEVRLSRIRFYEESYYLIDAIKNNAGIYVNDSYSKLLNDIADELLKNEPEIRNEVNLYAYRAPYVNAFSTDQGDLFFTIGLLAHAHNEAELAFIVGHEIIHYLKQHNITSFNQTVQETWERSKYKDLDIDESVERMHSFSRSLEREADLLSLDYFLKSPYNPKAIITALETLRTAHLGIAEQKFNYSLLFGPRFELSDRFLPHHIPSFSSDSTDDELSTHPNITERIKYCKEAITNQSGEGTSFYVHISSEEFIKLRSLARKEQVIQLYDNHFYALAIYNASIMHGEPDADKEWLQHFIDRSFRAAVEYRNGSNKWLEKHRKNYSGELYRVYHLLYKLKKYETATIHFLKTYKAYQTANLDFLELVPTYQVGASSDAKLWTIYAIQDMIKPQKTSWVRFQKEDFDTAKIRSTKMDHLLPELKLIFDSDEFINGFGRIETYYEEFRLNDDKKTGFESLAYYSLDFDKILLYNPYYIRVDENVEGYVDHRSTYDNEIKLLNAIDDAAKQNNLETVVLDVRRLKQADGDKFDDIALLKSYINRFTLKNGSKSPILPASEERIKQLRQKYDTDYVMWLGSESYKRRGFKDVRRNRVALFYIIFDMKKHTVVKTKSVDLGYMKDNQNLWTLYLNTLFKEL